MECTTEVYVYYYFFLTSSHYADIKSLQIEITTKKTEWEPVVSSASGYVLDVTEDVVG
jgi:hypothetical protein